MCGKRNQIMSEKEKDRSRGRGVERKTCLCEHHGISLAEQFELRCSRIDIEVLDVVLVVLKVN